MQPIRQIIEDAPDFIPSGKSAMSGAELIAPFK